MIFNRVNEIDHEAQVLLNILLNKLENNEIDEHLIKEISSAIYNHGYTAGRIVGAYYAKEERDGA